MNDLTQKVHAAIKAWQGLEKYLKFPHTQFRDEFSERISAIDDALLDLEGIAYKTGWISVKDRLPDPIYNPRVLAYMPLVDYQYAILVYDKGEWTDIGDDTYDPQGEVTHWMPMPESPDND